MPKTLDVPTTYKVALPRSKRHVALAIALRHAARIPKITKPGVRPYAERQLQRWYLRQQKHSYTSGEVTRHYKAWRLSQWARSVERLAKESRAEPGLATLRRQILAENTTLWHQREYRPYVDMVRVQTIVGKAYAVLREQKTSQIDTHGDRLLSYVAELYVPLAQWWDFHVSEEYEQWLGQ